MEVGGNTGAEPTIAEISLPHLWHFGFNSRSSPTTDDFFAKLLLPDLSSLKYSCSSDPSNIFLHSLKYLSLDVYLMREELIRALGLMPLLAELELLTEPQAPPPQPWWDRRDEYDEGTPEGLLERLSPRRYPVLCPTLHSLHLVNFRDISDEELLTFIQGRTGVERGDVTPLEYVHAKIAREMQSDIMPFLQPLIEGGLEISLEYEISNPYSAWEGVDLEY